MDKAARQRQYRMTRATKELDEIFESMKPHMRDKLIGLDGNIRRITKEASMCSVPEEVIQSRLPELFWTFFQEVAREEAEKVGGEGKVMRSNPSRERSVVNHARRGMGFEGLIDYSNQIYDRQGIAVINKRPTPVKVIRMTKGRITDAVFEKPSTVDYDGSYHGKPIVFEAKSTQELNRFDLKNVEEHQVEYLEKCNRHGAICFLLIEFAKHGTVYLLPYITFRHYWQSRKSGVRGTQSIPIAEFEVNAYEVGAGRVPLDYLKVVDRVWNLEVA